MLQESCAQPEVAILHLGGVLVLQKKSKILFCIFLEEHQDPAKAALLSLDCFSLVSAFPPFPD